MLAACFTFLANSADAQYGLNVISYDPKALVNGDNTLTAPTIGSGRYNPANTLGAPQPGETIVDFASLGLDVNPEDGIQGGSILIEMAPFLNVIGIDIDIEETTTDSRPCEGSNRYPERARVWVAQQICGGASSNPLTEPANWFLVGEICGQDGAIDLSEGDETACLFWARYVFIQDISDINDFLPADRAEGLDGFDVDAVTSTALAPPSVISNPYAVGAEVIMTETSLGTQKGGLALPASRAMVDRSLGLPGGSVQVDAANTFVSLGFKKSGSTFMLEGGHIVIKLSRSILNEEGADLIVYETSFNSANKTCSSYPEHARVYGSSSATGPWTELVAVQSNLGGNAGQIIAGPATGGTTPGSSSICKDGSLDLGQLSEICFVKIVDNTRPNPFPNNGDAYDVNAVVGISGQCASPNFRYESVLSMVPNETFSFNAFPNPASDQVSIEIEASDVNEDIIFEIIDFSGRVVRSENISVNASSYFISNYPIADLNNGVYMIVAKSKNANHMSKFIKMN